MAGPENDALSKIPTEPWGGVQQAAQTLGVKIGEGRARFDRVAHLPFSGAAALVLLAEHLDFSPLEVLQMPIVHSPEWAEGSLKDQYIEGTLPPVEDVQGLNVLLLGDVWRSGGLLSHAARRLTDLGAYTVKTGVMYMRTDHLISGARPEYFGAKTSGAIKFPWDKQTLGYGDILSVHRKRTRRQI